MCLGQTLCALVLITLSKKINRFITFRKVLKLFKQILTIRKALTCKFTTTEINNWQVLELQEYLSEKLENEKTFLLDNC